MMEKIAKQLYKCFYNMKFRCENPKCEVYKNYGARGIKVLFKSLDEFKNYIINELQIDPTGLTIDRIDNDGHYEKGNIRFVTRAENSSNRNPHNRHNRRLKRKKLRNKLGFFTS